MKRLFTVLCIFAMISSLAMAAPISYGARNVIPAEIQQIIVVDYHSINNSSTARALKDKVLPDTLKAFEAALRNAGVNTETDVEQLVFVTYRVKDGLRVVGIAQGQFPGQKLVARLRLQKIKGETYRTSRMYPMGSGMFMTLLDDSTMLFGENESVRKALDTRDGEGRAMTTNAEIMDLMSAVETESVWSVLDTLGTQTMLKSALGEAAQLADFDMIKNRLKGSRYTVKFDKGLDLDLNVVTSDSITAATLSSVLQAGVMFKKATATETEKQALEQVDVKADSRNLKMHFHTDDNKFQALLNSELFAAVSK